MRGSSSAPVIVVVHPDPQIQVAMKASLEAGGHLRVDTATGGQSAVERLLSGNTPPAAMIFEWEHFDQNAPKIMPGLVRARSRGIKPFVFCCSSRWQINDLHRAESLHVHSLFWSPVNLAILVKELVSLKRGNKSKSFRTVRQEISLRRQQGEDPADPRWQDRMAHLAVAARTRGGVNREELTDGLMGRMEDALGRPVSVKLGEAVVLSLRGDGHAYEQFVTTHGVDRMAVRKLCILARQVGGDSAKANPDGRTTPSAMALLLATDVMSRVKQRAEGRGMSDAYKEVRQAATGFLTDQNEAATFTMCMAHWLGVEVTILSSMPVDRARRMAERMVAEPKERRAKNMARLFLLAALLSANSSRDRKRDTRRDLRTLASLLNHDRIEGENPIGNLMELAAEINNNMSDFGMVDDDLPDFAELADLFGEAAADGDSPLEGDDMDALKRDLEALGIALEVEPELPDVSGDHERERILTLVSKEVGIPMEALHHMAPSNLAQSLPEVEIPDWKPEEKRLDVARAVARIVGQEQQKTGQVDLLMAFSQRFEDEFLMLHALLVGVGNCSGEKALRNARVALALPAAPAEAKDIKGYLAENELAQAFVALKDLPPREGVTAQLINLVAIALRNAGLNLEAEWLYRQGLRATPNRLSLLFNFARLKMDQDQPALAARLLRKALSIDPRHDASQRLLEQAKALAEGTPTAAAG